MSLENISMKLTDGIVINKLFNCVEVNNDKKIDNERKYINHNLNKDTIADFGSRMIKLYNPSDANTAIKRFWRRVNKNRRKNKVGKNPQ